MGSSAKKKREKKKDFQKVKLKVGKTKLKPSNHTDTSFKAKSIILSKQSLSETAPSAVSQFAHHVSMLRSKAETQRRESLAFLTSATSRRATGLDLPEPVVSLITKVQPLILDSSNSVRQQLLKLLKCFSAKDVESNIDQLLLYIRAGMSHLAVDVRMFALEVLNWLLNVAGTEIFSCAGGWMKTLQCFMRLLGWEDSQSSTLWSSNGDAVSKSNDSKALSKQLMALANFISTGMAPLDIIIARDPLRTSFPYFHTEQHSLPVTSKPFAHLQLFGAVHETNDIENGIYEDREDRQRLFTENFRSDIQKRVELFKKEGGELGRAASTLAKALSVGLADYDEA